MSLLQALAYFLREACVSLARSWKISLLAILTIAVSLFLAGVFLLAGGNLGKLVESWQEESRLVIYLEAEAGPEERERVLRQAAGKPWSLAATAVSAEDARRRFREAFPSLEDLLEGWGGDPLPASIEVTLDWPRLSDRVALDLWIGALRSDPAVSAVDDDRDWLRQLEAVVFVLRVLGMVLGAILLATAIFTISSVIRLTAYLYRDEIAVMRMVGATEFFIRGPFYVEGLLQGLAGGALAVAALFGAYALVVERHAEATLALLAAEFLTPAQLLALVGLGGFAGLAGAIASLRRESLGQTAETPEWTAG